MESSRAGNASEKLDAAAIIDGEDLGEDVIQALNERRSCAKVGFEMQGIKAQSTFIGNIKTDTLNARKKFDVGITKEVNGLHRIANHEAGAAFGLRPRGDEATEQIVLAAAGVLKFVNEQVVDAVSNRESGVRWLAVFILEHAESNLCDFNKVDHACFRKDDAEISCGPAK